MLLSSLISLRRDTDSPLSPEDIFGSSLGGIFTDDEQNQHGDDETAAILYRPSNPLYPLIELDTAVVDDEEQRHKFAHYLWNAGIMMAELVGGRPENKDTEGGYTNNSEWEAEEWWVDREEQERWSVKGHTVLELGAGVGLGGIMSALAGAEEVAISDYPAPPILDAISANMSKNLPPPIGSNTTVHGHQWGELTTNFATAHAHSYTRILSADNLWMPHEHQNLARSMLHFLSDSPDARIFVIAGFHTGRAKLAPFFEETVPAVGLEIEEIYEMDAEGKRRAWAQERDGGRENVGERKKWLVLARLRRAAT